MQAIDQGLWISYYNLPDSGRDEYLQWLHSVYIPQILKVPGVLWGAHYKSEKVPPASRLPHTSDPAVPKGADFILLFGGESAHTFSKGAAHYLQQAPGRFAANQTAEDRRMLGLRSGERVLITTEVARRAGPEAATRESRLAPAPCIQLGTFNGDGTATEEEMLTWYADWRFDALGRLPGCVAIRQLVSVVGWAKHGVLYEFTSRAGRDSHFPRMRELYPVEGQWSNRAVVHLMHSPESPIVASRLWPPIN
jgi:hypothetical protein